MALNVIYSDIEGERRPVPVGSDVAPGTPLIVGGRPAVTITGSGDHTNGLTTTGNDVLDTLLNVGVGNGGIGLGDEDATVAFTGTYAFPVTGASAATQRQTPVYITSGGTLTLTATNNTKFGVVEFFRGESGSTDTAVTIGVNLG